MRVNMRMKMTCPKMKTRNKKYVLILVKDQKVLRSDTVFSFLASSLDVP